MTSTGNLPRDSLPYIETSFPPNSSDVEWANRIHIESFEIFTSSEARFEFISSIEPPAFLIAFFADKLILFALTLTDPEIFPRPKTLTKSFLLARPFAINDSRVISFTFFFYSYSSFPCNYILIFFLSDWTVSGGP